MTLIKEEKCIFLIEKLHLFILVFFFFEENMFF